MDTNPGASRKENRKQRVVDFVIQGSILTMADTVVRIIGMLYHMLLSDIIGKQGNGYYMSASNVHNIPPILPSYSMPVAISKMISARLARGEYRNCSRILKVALIYATAVGDVAVAVLWLDTDLFAEPIKTPFDRYALKTLAPTIWIMAYLDVLRGHFQGTGTMMSAAVSQILEQIINTVVSVVAAGIPSGIDTSINTAQGTGDHSYTLGAAGGTIDTGADAFTVFLLFICPTAFEGREGRQLVHKDVPGRTGSYRRIFYVLIITVLPIVISSGIHNCSSVVGNHLSGQGMDKPGYLEDSIATYRGALGQYQLLSNILVVVSSTLSSSLIPSLIRAIANKDRREKLGRIATSIRFSLLTAIPAVVGIIVLAEPVYNLLFISEDNTVSIRSFTMGSLAVVFYSLSTITSAILQGLNHMGVPIHHAAIALVVHVATLEVFLVVFKMGIYNVVSANIISALVICLLNGYTIARSARYGQEHKRTLILPAIYAGFVGAAAYGVYRGICALLPHRLMGGRTGMAIAVFPSVAVAILVYAVLLVRFRAVEEEESKDMSGGRRLVRSLNRFKLLG